MLTSDDGAAVTSQCTQAVYLSPVVLATAVRAFAAWRHAQFTIMYNQDSFVSTRIAAAVRGVRRAAAFRSASGCGCPAALCGAAAAAHRSPDSGGEAEIFRTSAAAELLGPSSTGCERQPVLVANVDGIVVVIFARASGSKGLEFEEPGWRWPTIPTLGARSTCGAHVSAAASSAFFRKALKCGRHRDFRDFSHMQVKSLLSSVMVQLVPVGDPVAELVR